MKKDSRVKDQGRNQSRMSSKNFANRITIARILATPLFIVILCMNFRYHNYWAALLFILLASSDLLDGYVARKYDQCTPIGAMLDPLADKLLVFAALIFLIGRGVDAWMVYVILAREFLIMGLRSLVMSGGGSMPAKVSGKLKTASQIFAIMTVLLGIPYSWYFMLAATIITIYSGIEYLWIERRALRGIF
jgi:CDP-diacylglycerol--glycerol-3-phosphate 3-phosphatidyltransferase